jgi:hypothetical protein
MVLDLYGSRAVVPSFLCPQLCCVPVGSFFGPGTLARLPVSGRACCEQHGLLDTSPAQVTALHVPTP